MKILDIILAVLKLFGWGTGQVNRKQDAEAAKDRLRVEAEETEDARVASAEDARDRARDEYKRLHPKPDGP